MSDLTSDILLGFKNERARDEFAKAPRLLRDIAFAFAIKSNALGVRPIITRVREDAANQATQVHAAGRALDFRNEYSIAGGKTAVLYSPSQVLDLVSTITTAFPRSDGKVRILHHAVAGSTAHFHIQIGFSELEAGERFRFQ